MSFLQILYGKDVTVLVDLGLIYSFVFFLE